MRSLPLAVDMDGTLLLCDVLYAGMTRLLRERPLALVGRMPHLILGRPAFKRAIASAAALPIEALPVREDFLSYLRQQKQMGRRLVLATAADRKTAEAVAARFSLFEAVLASDGGVNLKGPRKAEALRTMFPDGFVYAGDSLADLAVWRVAAAAIACGARKDVATGLARLGTPIEARFE